MKLSARRLGQRRCRSVAVLTALLTLGLVAAAGGLAVARSGGRIAAPSASEPTVAVVQSASGPISVRRGSRGSRRALRGGDRLQLGDVIVPDLGGTAVIVVQRPAGVSSNANLIFIKPTSGTRPMVTLSGRPSREIVTIR